MKRFGLLAVLLLTASAFAQEEKEGWQGYSNPDIVARGMERRLEVLPLTGQHGLPHTGWSDDYWANNRGSINRRWTTQNELGFNLNSPSLTRAKAMSEAQLAELAPSEKYDLLRSRYDYPLVKRVALKANPEAESWAGICNGWAPASLNLKEPKPVTLTNAEGIRIPFGSSDVKALLSFYYAHDVKEPTRQIGRRCNSGQGLSLLNRGCGEDLNAGAFHVIMSNKLGVESRGFLADVDRYKEVWNQPIIGYTSQVVGSRSPSFGAARGTKRVVTVNTTLIYSSEVAPEWEPVLETSIQSNDQLRLQYDLELNERGEIIGGKWTSNSRPDFLWFRSQAAFTGDFAKLGELYEASTQY